MAAASTVYIGEAVMGELIYLKPRKNENKPLQEIVKAANEVLKGEIDHLLFVQQLKEYSLNRKNEHLRSL